MHVARLIFACGWLLFSAENSMAQSWPHHAVKVDLTAFAQKNFGFSYEFRPARRAGLEADARYWSHSISAESQVFEGDLVANFAERRVDSIFSIGDENHSLLGWQYLGTGRRLPVVPQFVAKNTLQFRLGYRFLFEKMGGRFALALQPGFVATRSQFYRIDDEFIQPEPEEVDAHQVTTFSGKWTIIKRTRYLQQARQMRSQEVWLPGLNYDIALTWRPTRRFFLEGRLIGGIHSAPAFRDNPPNSARLFYGRLVLQAGIFLDKKVEKLPPRPPKPAKLKKRKVENL